MNKVRINQGRVVESGYRSMFSLLLVLGMIGSIIGLNNILGFIIVLALSSLMILMWTSFYILEIDMKSHTYFDFTSVIGFKFGERKSFDGIEKAFINKTSYTQQLHGYGPNSYNKKSHVAKAYVKFLNGEKLFLVSDEDEKELIDRIQPILKKLDTRLG